MSNIVWVTWDGGGNVPPALAIARELSRRGHSVRFMGHAEQEAAIGEAGFDFVRGRNTRAFSALGAHSPLEMLAAFGDAGMGQDVVAEVAAHPADLVVVDCLLFGVMHAVRQAGLRYAVLEHFYDGYYRSSLRGPVGLWMRLTRRAPQQALAGAALRLVTSLPELDPIDPPPPNLRQVGPVVEIAPAVPAARPTILVSTSTFDHGGLAKPLRALVDATRGLDARVVVTCGPVVDASALPTHPGVEVHSYVPHVELMPAARLFIGHGGHGSTMQALAHDLPVLVMPMASLSDQPLVGKSVTAAGAGRMVGKNVRTAELAAVVAELVGDGPHRAAAARLGAAIREMPGATLGADAIEGALSARPRSGPPNTRGAAPLAAP